MAGTIALNSIISMKFDINSDEEDPYIDKQYEVDDCNSAELPSLSPTRKDLSSLNISDGFKLAAIAASRRTDSQVETGSGVNGTTKHMKRSINVNSPISNISGASRFLRKKTRYNRSRINSKDNSRNASSGECTPNRTSKKSSIVQKHSSKHGLDEEEKSLNTEDGTGYAKCLKAYLKFRAEN